MVTTEEFSRWACTLIGSDGGSLDADIWFCGIEWGGERERDYYTKELVDEIKDGFTFSFPLYDWESNMMYSYGRNVAKLYCEIRSVGLENYKELSQKVDGSSIFRLNLFPIPFKHASDNNWELLGVDVATGFKKKEFYKQWCILNRFPFIESFARQYVPKIIVCFGVGYVKEYLVCFGGSEALRSNFQSQQLMDRYMYWTKLNFGSYLFVLPFPSGPRGLNSDDLIRLSAKLINTIVAC